MYIHKHIYICINIYTCTTFYICVQYIQYTNTNIYICMYVCIYIYVHVCYTTIYIYTCKYIYILIHLLIYIYYLHICTHLSWHMPSTNSKGWRFGFVIDGSDKIWRPLAGDGLFMVRWWLTLWFFSSGKHVEKPKAISQGDFRIDTDAWYLAWFSSRRVLFFQLTSAPTFCGFYTAFRRWKYTLRWCVVRLSRHDAFREGFWVFVTSGQM